MSCPREFTTGLRDLADLVDEHPELASTMGVEVIQIVDAAAVGPIMGRIGGAWESKTFDKSTHFVQHVGPHRIILAVQHAVSHASDDNILMFSAPHDGPRPAA
jgi:hypothetical protein